MVVRHLKNLRTPGVDDSELMRYMDFLLTFLRHVAAEVIYVLRISQYRHFKREILVLGIFTSPVSN
jgi:hypothetical protein